MTATRPAQLGACACCGAPTRSLFAMGHDARFRSRLAAALIAGGWDAMLDWHTSSIPESVTVRDAIVRIGAAIDRDWTEKLERQASRLARTPAGKRPDVTLSPTPSPVNPRRVPAGGYEPRDFARERVDSLLDRLSGVALTGQWGWWRPIESRPPGLAGTDGHTRFPARVQATHRKDDSSLIDLFAPAAFRAGLIPTVVAVGCDPQTWLHDDDARSA